MWGVALRRVTQNLFEYSLRLQLQDIIIYHSSANAALGRPFEQFIEFERIPRDVAVANAILACITERRTDRYIEQYVLVRVYFSVEG